MALEALDRWSRGRGPLHRATPLAKWVGMALGLASVMLAAGPGSIVAVAAGWLALLAWSGVPVLPVLGLAAYAAVFAAAYAWLSWEGSWVAAMGLVLRAVGAATVVLSLLATTPFTRLFQPWRRWLPAPLADALLLTYRSFFMLARRWSHLMAALHLRQGSLPWYAPRRWANLIPCFGVLILSALDHSEAFYEAMLVRGYRGRWEAGAPPAFTLESVWPLLLGLVDLLVVGAWGR